MKRSSLLLRWWLALDKTILWSFIALASIGTVLIATASPPVASRIGIGFNHFIHHHLLFVFVSLALVMLTSAIPQKYIKMIAIIGLILTMIALVIVLQSGTEIKGAKRWIHVMGFSLQPSELVKPLFAIANALILASTNRKKYLASFLLYFSVAALLITEPDFGMSAIITMIWVGQIIITGISPVRLGVTLCVLSIAALACYYTLPHVQQRVHNFFNPSKGDNFQISKSLSAFSRGGLTGVGPGEGVVKLTLPDSHSDFIFAVAAEEFGSLLCLIIIALYGILIVKITIHMINLEDSFTILTLFGLVIQLSSQALINMGVNINLLPTKGMTLPFISYGGSSSIANALSLGVVLALTRTKFQISLIFDEHPRD